jgi:hypothetical protein
LSQETPDALAERTDANNDSCERHKEDVQQEESEGDTESEDEATDKEV